MKPNVLPAGAALLIFCTAIHTAAADTRQLTATDDTWVNVNSPDTNYGSADRLFVHSWGPKSALIRVDTDFLDGATVNSATASIRIDAIRDSGDIEVFTVTSAWDEGSVSWNTRPEVQPAPFAVIGLSESSAGSVIDIDITALAREWADGTITDAGLMLATGDGIRALFDSKETVSGVPPTFSFDYVPATPTGAVGVGTAPVVLDLSSPPVVIDEPGYYVLDRNWEIEFPYGSDQIPVIEITASNVLVDFTGFGFATERIGGQEILITGDSVTLKNGHLSAIGDGGGVIRSSGRNTLLQRMEVFGSDASFALELEQGGRIEDSTIIEGARIGGQAHIYSTRFACNRRCLVLTGTGSEIVDSSSSASTGDALQFNVSNGRIENGSFTSEYFSGISVNGSGNIVRSNSAAGGESAISVNADGNVIDRNFISPVYEAVSGNIGIEFTVSGNFYGGNRVKAMKAPFSLGATTQTDWGGNVAY